MITTVIINDFVIDRRSMVLLTKNHFDLVEAIWEKEDKILVEMQDSDLFAGKNRWCDLRSIHLRLMIAHNMTMCSKLSDNLQMDKENPVVASLHLLIAILIHGIQKNTESFVELFRIVRMSEHEITYDFTASFNMTIDIKKKSDFRLVVDNE